MEEKSTSLEELSKLLGQACDILHGEVQVFEYKNIIFGFIALKYLSGLKEYQYEQSGGTSVEINLPKEAMWSTLIEESSDIGGALAQAARLIEKHNPYFDEVFSSIGFCSQLKLSEKTLKTLVNHFEKMSFYSSGFESSNVLGEVCDYFLEQFAKNQDSYDSESYTPAVLSELLVNLVSPTKGMSVYDPTAGVGGTLSAVLKYVRSNNNAASDINLFAQEINRASWAISKINLFLHGAYGSQIECDDTLKQPSFIQGDQVAQFDRVVASPPFGLAWDSALAESDIFSRFKLGMPPRSNADLAFIQHMLESLSDNGLMATMVAPGCLFRGGKEKEIRESLVKTGLIETIINLPSGMFYNTGIPANILIINKNKSQDRKNKILFIDASSDYVKTTRNINSFNKNQLDVITSTYSNFSEIVNFSRVVTNEEIEENEFSLSVRRYVDNSPEANQLRALKAQFSDYELGDLSSPDICLGIKSLGVKTEVDCKGNSIFIPKIPTMPIYVEFPSKGVKQENYFQVELNPNKILSGYASQFFQSEIGRLILHSLAEGVTIQRISIDSLKSHCLLVAPSIETQKHVLQATEKLQKLEGSLSSFSKEISLNPSAVNSILDRVDGMLDSLSELSEADRLLSLVRKGESKTIEFKQSLSLDVRRSKNDKKYSPIKEQSMEHGCLKTVVGFINSEGGELLVGVHDNGEVTGIEEELRLFHKGSIDSFLKRFRDLASDKIGRDFYPYFNPSIIDVNGRKIMLVQCKRSEKSPCYLEEEFYVRTAPATDKLTSKQANEYIAKHFSQ